MDPFGHLYMDMSVLVNQQDLPYNSSMQPRDVVWRTYWERWVIVKSFERESEKPVSVERLEDDNDEVDLKSVDFSFLYWESF